MAANCERSQSPPRAVELRKKKNFPLDNRVGTSSFIQDGPKASRLVRKMYTKIR
jgi:hypothetical protein